MSLSNPLGNTRQQSLFFSTGTLRGGPVENYDPGAAPALHWILKLPTSPGFVGVSRLWRAARRVGRAVRLLGVTPVKSTRRCACRSSIGLALALYA